VATGDGSSFAIKTNGTLWAWGNNSNGQLGLGNTTNRSSPVQVGSLTNWSNIVASGSFVVAVKTDKTLWAWGSGSYGRLGLGNTTSYSSPKQIGSLTNWNKIAAAFSTALATTQ
jgi:alpha-tubulin suppressor-like RCC1 family protein